MFCLLVICSCVSKFLFISKPCCFALFSNQRYCVWVVFAVVFCSFWGLAVRVNDQFWFIFMLSMVGL